MLSSHKPQNIHLLKAKPLNWDDYYKVHSKEYVNKIINGASKEISKYSWITWSKSFLRAQRYTSGAIYYAAKSALKNNISGALVVEGHHAQKNRGSGYSTFNNLSVAASRLLEEKTISRLAIVDFDLHFGDGTASIFKNDFRVAIFDIYGQSLSGDASMLHSNGRLINFRVNSKQDYFSAIDNLKPFLKKHKPELVFYIAGMDVFEKDRYGGIKGMREEQIIARDKVLLGSITKLKIPTVFTLGGGYVDYRGIDGFILSKKAMELRRKKLAQLHLGTIKMAENIISELN